MFVCYRRKTNCEYLCSNIKVGGYFHGQYRVVSDFVFQTLGKCSHLRFVLAPTPTLLIRHWISGSEGLKSQREGVSIDWDHRLCVHSGRCSPFPMAFRVSPERPRKSGLNQIPQVSKLIDSNSPSSQLEVRRSNCRATALHDNRQTLLVLIERRKRQPCSIIIHYLFWCMFYVLMSSLYVKMCRMIGLPQPYWSNFSIFSSHSVNVHCQCSFNASFSDHTCNYHASRTYTEWRMMTNDTPRLLSMFLLC